MPTPHERAPRSIEFGVSRAVAGWSRRLGPRARERAEMSTDDVIGLVISLLIGAYLVIALLFPEKL
jgi:K+-transporting ATPase KdpF subunit